MRRIAKDKSGHDRHCEFVEALEEDTHDLAIQIPIHLVIRHASRDPVGGEVFPWCHHKFYEI